MKETRVFVELLAEKSGCQVAFSKVKTETNAWVDPQKEFPGLISYKNKEEAEVWMGYGEHIHSLIMFDYYLEPTKGSWKLLYTITMTATEKGGEEKGKVEVHVASHETEFGQVPKSIKFSHEVDDNKYDPNVFVTLKWS